MAIVGAPDQVSSRYRLYLDESGHHGVRDFSDIGKRYLGLVGVAISGPVYTTFADKLEALKRTHLDYDRDDPPILHREDILHCRGCFSKLSDPAKKEPFDKAVLDLIDETNFIAFAIVLDKQTHVQADYRSLVHPYHYCLHAMLERYCGYLNLCARSGDVIAESRGGSEDLALKAEFRGVWNDGARFLDQRVAQKVLTSKELKLKPKHSNVAGLQLADMLAHPLTRDVLAWNARCPPPATESFAAKLTAVARKKYHKHAYSGVIKGYGRVLLD